MACRAKRRVINLSHILVDKDKADLLDEAEKQLDAGTSFADVASQLSVCSITKSRGGQIGWLSQGDYFPEFESVAFATPIGKRARATTPRGHHLILVHEDRYPSPSRRTHTHTY